MKNQKFKFEGNWEVELMVENLGYSIIQSIHMGIVKQDEGLFTFEIFDEFNANPDPEIPQTKTINYLLDKEHQTKILTNLLEYSRSIIYPHYKTFMWESEYPECYPKLEKVEDLKKLFGINRILIKRIHHEDYAYYIFDCSSCLDYEHGITITLFKRYSY